MNQGQMLFTVLFLGALMLLGSGMILYIIADRLFWDTFGKKEALIELKLTQAQAEAEIEETRLRARGAYFENLKLEDGPVKRTTLVIDPLYLPSYGTTEATTSGPRVPGALATHFSPRYSIAQNSVEGNDSLEKQEITIEKMPEMEKYNLMPILSSNYEDIDHENVSLLLGKHADGAIIAATTEQLMISAICGNTGGGKSILLRSMLIQWYLHFLEGVKLNFVMIDFTKRELNIWKPAQNFLYLPGTVSLADNVSDAEDLLGKLVLLMGKRASLPEEERAKLPWLIIAIEELIDTQVILSKVARDRLDALIRLGRSSNFRIVWTAQYIRGGDIGKALASQIHSIFVTSLRQGTQGIATAQALGFSYEDVPNARGAFAYDLATIKQRGVLQVPYVSERDVQTILVERLPRVENQEEAIIRVYNTGIHTVRSIADKLTDEGIHKFATTSSPIGAVLKGLKEKGRI